MWVGLPTEKAAHGMQRGGGVRGEGGGGVGGTRIINCFCEGVQDLRCSLGGLSFQRRQVQKSLLLEEKVKVFLFLFNFVFVEGQGWGPGKME